MELKNVARICQYKGVDIVHVIKPKETLEKMSDLKHKILTECDQVQRSVWNPKQTIEENTINNGLLLLLEHDGRYIGFLSSDFRNIDDYNIVYLHDVMINRDYQGMGFCRLLSLLLLIEVFNIFGTSKFLFMTATSNSRLISTLYTKHNIFKNVSFPIPNEFHRMLLSRLGREFFGGPKVNTEACIIEKMWYPPPDERQHISRAKNLTSLLGKKLKLEDGDALAIIASVDEEAILNANSYIRGALDINLDIDL